jgi:4-hydroxy-tetrahydrodipicolinate reductase
MRIILVGYGRMGRAIEQAAHAKGHSVTARIDIHNAAELNAETAAQADVAVEFTGPESAFANVCRCLELGLPVVTGSTGWLDRYPEAVALCLQRNGALLHASNFSIGVNILFEVNRQLARLMAAHTSYDISIHEIHHTAKKDAPSGTAISLAEQAIRELPGKEAWVDHETGDPADLVITSERTDPYPGLHRVTYRSAIDELQLTHNALSRDGFAAGAVLAAEYLHPRKGVHSMKDVLGIGEEAHLPGADNNGRTQP